MQSSSLHTWNEPHEVVWEIEVVQEGHWEPVPVKSKHQRAFLLLMNFTDLKIDSFSAVVWHWEKTTKYTVP